MYEARPSADEVHTEVRTAALTPPTEMVREREADLPTVLSSPDAQHYARIFALQADRSWAAADHEIGLLQDTLLVGAVLADRYLNPRYHATYPELAAWLAAHADEPDAKAVYALAVKRHTAGAPAPDKPIVVAVAPRPRDDLEGGPRPLTLPAQKPVPHTVHGTALASQIRSEATLDPHKAEALLVAAEAKKSIDAPTSASLRATIAEAYLAAGEAQEAFAISNSAKDPAFAPIAHWTAGLAAWRLGRMTEAQKHFEALARSPGQTGWTKSAAAFWAARVALRGHRPEHVAYWLGIAAEHPRTFYGLIARRILGVNAYLNFEAEPFTEFDARIVTSIDAGRRALALVAVGQRARAEIELRALALRASPTLLQSLAAVADRANLPSLSLQLAGALASSDGRNHDRALFPVPRWTPHGGFTVDRALLFGLMRQESLFAPHVQSSAGALGLMQLMPATARSMAARTGESQAERSDLADPELNLTLAQEYVQTLLGSERIKGNLVLFAVAYNWGPTASLRWQAKWPEFLADPLLFLESVPSQETRTFAHRVLTNYWIYRERLGQPQPDLDALAAGDWPTYTALDSSSEQDGRHAAHR